MGKRTAKPKKPHPDFPLFPHQTGRWAKKVRGKLRYFGKIDGDTHGQAALAKWLEQKDELLAGRTPRPKREGLTVADLCNQFLTSKQARVESGELAPRSFERYHNNCKRLADVFGRDRLVDDLRPEDFQRLRQHMASLWGPQALGIEVQMVRMVFKFGLDSGLMEKLVRFGPDFTRPSQKTLRLVRAKNGPRVFEPQDLRLLIDKAGPIMRAMLLLGINGGLGNTDLGCLPIGAVDLERGWLDYPRPKTGITRRIPLWPETVQALRQVLAERIKPKDPGDSHLLFISPRGESYVGNHRGYRVTEEMRVVTKRAKLQAKGRTFYDLRRTFETIADGARDPVATSAIMGHADASMAGIYRQRIDDDRLRAVVEFVRKWLFS